MTLEAALHGKVDGRTVQGLKRASERALVVEKRRVEGTLMRNYLKLVSYCQCLADENMVLSMATVELQSMLAALADEVKLPAPVQMSLLKRRCAEHAKSKQWTALLLAVNPFAQMSQFDPAEPQLSSVDVPVKSKMNFFSSCLLSSVVVSSIFLGIDGLADLQELLEAILQTLGAVDMVELDNLAAAVHGQAMGACQGLLALSQDEIAMGHKDSTLGWSHAGLKRETEGCCRFGGGTVGVLFVGPIHVPKVCCFPWFLGGGQYY